MRHHLNESFNIYNLLKNHKMITKSIKFHTAENASKKSKIKDFLLECSKVSNHLMSLHFGFFVETTKYDFINNTKDYNHFYSLRSHHYQQIQSQVYTKLTNRYNQILSELDCKNKYLNYLKFFLFNWDDTENYLNKKYEKTENDFYNKVLEYWVQNKEQVKQIVRVTFLKYIRNTKPPVFKRLNIILDSRTACLKSSIKSTKYKSWLSIYTNETTNLSKSRYKQIHIPIKISKYHEKILHKHTLNNSYILKFDSIYDRLEIIGTYSTEPLHIYKSQVSYETCIGIDLGVKNLMTMSNGFQLNTEAMEQEFNKFLKYEKQIKRLESHGISIGTKYLREQQKLTNKVQNLINRTLHNEVPDGTSLVVLEDLEFKDSSPNRRLNYLLRRFRLQGLVTKLKFGESDFPFKIETINPAYTSQQCHVCGYTDRNNRKTQAVFQCLNCGIEINADINASINIKERFFDNDIKKCKYRGEIKKYLKDKFEAHQVTNSVTSELSTQGESHGMNIQ